MSCNKYSRVKVTGISFVVPDNIKYSVDDFASFFDNNPKKISHAKKIMGYGTTYPVPEGVTAVDMLEVAANDLISNMNIDKDTIAPFMQ